MRKYQVKGILKRGDNVKPFSLIIKSKSAIKANKSVKEMVYNYCKQNYSSFEPIQCIINKKTVRYENV